MFSSTANADLSAVCARRVRARTTRCRYYPLAPGTCTRAPRSADVHRRQGACTSRASLHARPDSDARMKKEHLPTAFQALFARLPWLSRRSRSCCGTATVTTRFNAYRASADDVAPPGHSASVGRDRAHDARPETATSTQLLSTPPSRRALEAERVRVLRRAALSPPGAAGRRQLCGSTATRYLQIQSRFKAGVGRGVDLEQAGARVALAESNLRPKSRTCTTCRRATSASSAKRRPRTCLDADAVQARHSRRRRRGDEPPCATAPPSAPPSKRCARRASWPTARESAYQPQGRSPRARAPATTSTACRPARDTTAEIVLNWNLFNGGADPAAGRCSAFEDLGRHADRFAQRRVRVDGLADVDRVAPISMARQISPIRSPACVPTMPPPTMRCVASSNSSLVKPSSRPLAMARPEPPTGTGPCRLDAFGLGTRPRSCRPRRPRGRCRPRSGSRARRKRLLSPARLRPPHAPRARPCAPASAGRRCRRSRRCAARWCASGCRRDEAAVGDRDAGLVGADFLPFGLRPTALQHQVVELRLLRAPSRPRSLTRMPVLGRLGADRLGLQHDVVEARRVHLLPDLDQVAVGALHQAVEHLDHVDARARASSRPCPSRGR
jgi:hypothetical protein